MISIVFVLRLNSLLSRSMILVVLKEIHYMTVVIDLETGAVLHALVRERTP